jgi:EmrB/QacA subfamily drug resistance transporter
MNNPERPLSKRQANYTFIIVMLAILMAGIDSTIVSVGLPALLTDLHTNLAMVAWTMNGFQFSQSVVMPIAGKLSDDFGRKRLFLIAVIIFTTSSIGVGMSSDIFLVIIFRFIQGIGGGAFMPSATGIISDTFGQRRMTAIGLIGSIFSIGAVMGPNVGGFLIDNYSWHWMFFINVPIGILLLIFGLKVLPGSRTSNDFSKRRIDVIGIGLFVGAIFSLLYGLTNWAHSPQGIDPITIVVFAFSGAFFYFFMKHEGRTAQPMIETSLLRWRPFLGVNIYNFVFGAAMFGVASFVPYYATVAYGTTAAESGLIITPRFLAMIVVSATTSIMIVRFRYRKPMIIGLLLISLCHFLLSFGYHDVNILGVGLHDIPLLGLMVMLSGIGMGIANPAANNAALDLIPEKAAAVAGLRGMFRMLGGMVGTAVVTLILSPFQDQAVGMQTIFIGASILFVLLIPVVFMIPDLAITKGGDKLRVEN